MRVGLHSPMAPKGWREFKGDMLPFRCAGYLSRYTHRVAISNCRLIASDQDSITFRYKDYRADGRARFKRMTLATDEFIRRFLIHVLPKGIRHYGLLARPSCAGNIARARELRADLHRVQSAPYPSSHAKARMREEIEQLARRGAVDVSALVEHDGDSAQALAFGEVVDTVGLFAWLCKDALIAKLDREIEAETDDKASLSPEARQKAAAEVEADLLYIERQTVELVWVAQSQNLPAEHSDLSPQSVLGVRLISRPSGNGVVESSRRAEIAPAG
jgi:Putative transposase